MKGITPRVEADGAVEGEARLEPGQALRVEGQVPLGAQQQIEEEKAEQVEEQQGDGVAAPALLPLLVDPGDAVDAALYRAKDGMEPRPAPFVDGHHEEPERLRQGEQDDDIQGQVAKRCDGHRDRPFTGPPGGRGSKGCTPPRGRISGARRRFRRPWVRPFSRTPSPRRRTRTPRL